MASHYSPSVDSTPRGADSTPRTARGRAVRFAAPKIKTVASITSPSSKISQGSTLFKDTQPDVKAIWSRKVPDNLEKLGTCFTLKQAVTAGILSERQATNYCSKSITSASSDLSDVLTIWELCEHVSSPSFAFLEDVDGAADGDSQRDNNSSCSQYSVSKHEDKYGCKCILSPGFAFLNDVESILDSTDRRVSTGEVAHKLDVSTKAPQLLMAQKRKPEMIVEGLWELGKCDGVGSAQNPQVQLQSARLTWMGLELLVNGPSGRTVELWVLKGSRWGHRRPKLVHVLADTASLQYGPRQILDASATRVADTASLQYGPRQIRCECELLADDVITIVLACDGGDDSKGVSQKQQRLDSERGGRLAREESMKLGTDYSVFIPCSLKDTSGSPVSEKDVDFETDAAVVVPSFRLTITTSQPLARGPVLLPQRHKRDAAVEPRQPVLGEIGHDTYELCTQRSMFGTATTPISHANIDIAKIPTFAEAYSHAGEGLSEKIWKELADASDICCRRSRLAFATETKQVLESSDVVKQQRVKLRPSVFPRVSPRPSTAQRSCASTVSRVSSESFESGKASPR